MASEVTMESVEGPHAPLVYTPSTGLVTDPREKKTWAQFREAVRATKKQQVNMVNKVPHTFTYRTIETPLGPRTRLYFLGVPPGQRRENTLLYVDVPCGVTAIDLSKPLEWKNLLETFSATPLLGQYTKEEQLLRERKRLGHFGITSYNVDTTSGRFVFPACNSLYTFVDSVGSDGQFQTNPVFPTEVISSALGVRLDPQLCPHNPHLLAFINNSDVWVTNILTGEERRLTFAHKGCKNIAEDPKSAGVPSFVVQEEFDRYTGYWWQPCKTTDDGTYRVLYEEVDESEVDILHIVSPDEHSVDDYRYPRAGTANAKCILKMLEFSVNENRVCNVKELHMKEALSHMFPWLEYIVRAGWTADSKYVWAQILSRNQDRLALVLISPDNFTMDAYDIEMQEFDQQSSNSGVYMIYQDTSDIWINVSDILHFFPQISSNEISFIWSSEKSGFRHLYHVTSNLELVGYRVDDKTHDNAEGRDPVSSLDADFMFSGISSKPSIKQELALTHGDWAVTDKIWVDDKKNLLYFTGTKDTPLESHLYVLDLECPGSAITRLTQLGFSHNVCLDQHCTSYTSVFSSIAEGPRCHILKIEVRDANHIASPVSSLLDLPEDSNGYKPGELFSCPSKSGDTFYGMVYKPHNYIPGEKYPTVLYVYGGPHTQLVTNSYKGLRFLRLHMFASLGYAVVVLDCRGSSNRGVTFESHLKDKMGTVEIADQVEGLHWIASQVGYIDIGRVAIHGWSYGGYLALMGLSQRPDIFKLAIAGAPVTSWALYDTGYTERYMGTPQTNSEPYKAGSVLEYVDKFPNEENRLLIVHGLIDENVHFLHTSSFVNALVKACKPYTLQVYPNERHGIRNPEASEHYETMVLSFLQQHL
ncbi:unnamed protein product [Owenia fusiformis]|uniref:Prolyl endopeptidase n=1 Tax=Owenia fusiformis TaxID=6347 RepID=A0A8S4P387_OWEFU|nr:unnamed protein product [Owenia fusiformis]